MPLLVRARARRAEALVHADGLHAIPIAQLPFEVIAGDEAAEPRVERADVIVLEVDLDEGLPVEVVLDGLDLVQHVALEVELFRDAEVGEIARDVAHAVEEHAVPFAQVLARQVEARHVGELGRADVLALAVVAPAVQRAGDGSAGKISRALEHDRLPMAADVGDQVVAPAVVHERPGAVGFPVEHAIVAGIRRHLLMGDVAGAAREKKTLLGRGDLGIEVPGKGQVGSRARERFLAREIRHYPNLHGHED